MTFYCEAGNLRAFLQCPKQCADCRKAEKPKVASFSFWYRSQAAPTSTNSLVTVLMLTSQRRVVARRLMPSVRHPRIWTRFSIGRRFMANRSFAFSPFVKHIVQFRGSYGGIDR